MNQILSIDYEGKDKKRKNKEPRMRNNGPIEIGKIVIFFAIAMIIFGVFMIGTGSYSMYKEAKAEKAKIKPTISIARESEEANQLILKINHNTSLSKISYQWNDEEATQIQAEGRKSIEQTIDIPTGDNKLTVYATDINGLESKYVGQYQLKGSIQINIETQNPKIKVTATGEEELSFMTYKWDDEEEKTVQINDTKIEQIIDVPEGEHHLTVIVVDINNKTEKKEQDVNGVREQGDNQQDDEESKPQVSVTLDDVNNPQNFVIKATDEAGIKRVEFIRNETDKNALDYDRARPSVEDRKTFEFSYPLEEGENRLEVRVYNENGQETVQRVKLTK